MNEEGHNFDLDGLSVDDALTKIINDYQEAISDRGIFAVSVSQLSNDELFAAMFDPDSDLYAIPAPQRKIIQEEWHLRGKIPQPVSVKDFEFGEW